jgi:hypothetical protein
VVLSLKQYVLHVKETLHKGNKKSVELFRSCNRRHKIYSHSNFSLLSLVKVNPVLVSLGVSILVIIHLQELVDL